MEVVAGGFAFGWTGEQKMEMESLPEAEGWEVETIRVYPWELLPAENINAI